MGLDVGSGVGNLSGLQVVDLAAGNEEEHEGEAMAVSRIFSALAGDGCGIVSLPCRHKGTLSQLDTTGRADDGWRRAPVVGDAGISK